MGKSGRGIPDRWEQYSNMGRQIPGTRFIAFKVPLKEELLNLLDATYDFFDPRSAMDHCSNLGLVIDLTNTDRYYDPDEFLSNNVAYYKLKTAGHLIPNAISVYKFFRIVEQYFGENKHNDKLIGVHCTHGVNRTGYLICRYMIQQLCVPPDEAISAFNSARGHELERDNYIEDLRKMSWKEPSLLKSPSGALQRRLSYGPYDDRPKFGMKRERETDDDNYPNMNQDQTPPYFPHMSKYRKINPPSDSHVDNLQTGGMSSSRYFGNIAGAGNFGRTESPFVPNGCGFNVQQRKFEPSPPREPELFGRASGEPPRFGKAYYENYFGNDMHPRYDSDFYRRGGGGIGPHRPPPRSLLPVPNDGRAPRQYRGPRPYQSPQRDLEDRSIPGTRSPPEENMQPSLISVLKTLLPENSPEPLFKSPLQEDRPVSLLRSRRLEERLDPPLRSPLLKERLGPQLRSPLLEEPLGPPFRSPLLEEPLGPPFRSPLLEEPRGPPFRSPLLEEPRGPPFRSPLLEEPRGPPFRSPLLEEPRGPPFRSPLLEEPRGPPLRAPFPEERLDRPLRSPMQNRKFMERTPQWNDYQSLGSQNLGTPYYMRNTGSDFLLPVDGPRRTVFSPGTRSNVFSPDNDWTPRQRSSRFNPY